MPQIRVKKQSKECSRSLRKKPASHFNGLHPTMPLAKELLVHKLGDDIAAAKLKLIHITKNAGTALEQWGKDHGYSWGKQWPAVRQALGHKGSCLLPPQTGKMRSEPWHIPPQYFCRNPYDGYEVFAVVRNPYARIISEFGCPWKGFQAPMQAKEKGQRKARLALRAKATASDLNAWVEEQLGNGRAQPPFSNGHMVPQYLYIFDANGKRQVPSENVLRMENLDKDFAALRARYGIMGSPLLHLNESDMKCRFDVVDLSEEARQLIEKEYSEDFKRFGYRRL